MENNKKDKRQQQPAAQSKDPADAAAAKTAPAPETVTVPKKEYEELKADAKLIQEIRERMLRLGADFENYKKRAQKDREELFRYSSESFILEFLFILDNFERAFQAADKTQDFKVLHQGIEMILKEVDVFLKEKGVKRMEVLGKQFDPHRHEAMEHVAGDMPENTIVEELQAGYELNGKVIRPAKVKVSNGNK